MSSLTAGLILGAALVVIGAAPASTQSYRYATDPDPFIYSQLPREHWALDHPDAVLPRTATARGGAAPRFGWSGNYANEAARFDRAKGYVSGY